MFLPRICTTYFLCYQKLRACGYKIMPWNLVADSGAGVNNCRPTWREKRRGKESIAMNSTGRFKVIGFPLHLEN